ncbi:hypothetical protein AOQ73_40225 [Bradyrhizobium pachyrhizi]|nr:hypothetical protein AOQ73_40225 [Bradyrhizobium pachyrhizi]
MLPARIKAPGYDLLRASNPSLAPVDQVLEALFQGVGQMLPKIAHVIIIGLSEEERGKLDESTRKILHFSDPSWEYKSYGCDTLQEAAAIAKDMARVDIVYVAGGAESESIPYEKFGLELDYEILGELMENHSSKPVVSYARPDRPNKLATAIFALWRDRSKSTSA